MPVYDFECPVCCKTFEGFGTPEEEFTSCPDCSGPAKKIFSKARQFMKFPEGLWDIGEKEIYVGSRRQLREAFKRHNDNPDQTKHSYPKYLDGYGGY